MTQPQRHRDQKFVTVFSTKLTGHVMAASNKINTVQVPLTLYSLTEVPRK